MTAPQDGWIDGEAGRSGSGEPSGLRPFGAEPAAQSQAKPLVPNAWPEKLTPELVDLLGRQCFTFIRFAQVYRKAGFDIPTQAEAEQAFFLHRFLGHWFTHGDEWRLAAQEDLRAVHATAQVIEARRAATAKTGAVEDESAVPKGCAQPSAPKDSGQ